MACLRIETRIRVGAERERARARNKTPTSVNLLRFNFHGSYKIAEGTCVIFVPMYYTKYCHVLCSCTNASINKWITLLPRI